MVHIIIILHFLCFSLGIGCITLIWLVYKKHKKGIQNALEFVGLSDYIESFENGIDITCLRLFFSLKSRIISEVVFTKYVIIKRPISFK